MGAGLKLPNLEDALVEKSKIQDYLLSEERSGGKAEFFTAFGFVRAEWATLRDALLKHAFTHEIARVSATIHGVKYIIESDMQTPDGRFPKMRAVWIMDTGNDAPRLVTAYPLEGIGR